MKKRSALSIPLFVLGLFLTGAVFVSNNLNASEDVDNFEKSEPSKNASFFGYRSKDKRA